MDTSNYLDPWTEPQRYDAIKWQVRESLFEDSAFIAGTLERPLVEIPWYYGKTSLIHLLTQRSGRNRNLIFQITWGLCLERYTTTELTESNDRLSALAGIAQLVQNKLRYTASYGLWLDFFIEQLQWSTIPGVNDTNKPIPSWSWLSTEKSVFTVRDITEELRTARISRYPPVTGFQPLSDLYVRLPRPASFMVYGSMKSCQAYPWFDEHGSHKWDIAPAPSEVSDLVESAIQRQWDACILKADDPLQEEVKHYTFEHKSRVKFAPDAILRSREMLCCFLLSRVIDGRGRVTDHGLVLRQDGCVSTSYRRVGYFAESGYESPASSQVHSSHSSTVNDPHIASSVSSDSGDIASFLYEPGSVDSGILENSEQNDIFVGPSLHEGRREDADFNSSIPSPTEAVEIDDSHVGVSGMDFLTLSEPYLMRSNSEPSMETFSMEYPAALDWADQIAQFTFFNGSETEVEIEIF
ncbi:hypothetical protein E8E13_010480 [Curvularia kusanoi]|uniref:Uncharacterized protein n=1 Tax=Curvularia kusanoi TaxID=90978 RepID=A0A9P4THR3_CURKU|nr:hypothetical protein E8E13_010480 [Curvularia kusanoi]